MKINIQTYPTSLLCIIFYNFLEVNVISKCMYFIIRITVNYFNANTHYSLH